MLDGYYLNKDIFLGHTKESSAQILKQLKLTEYDVVMYFTGTGWVNELESWFPNHAAEFARLY